MNQKKISAWAGMSGSLLFVLVFTIEGWLRSGYNPLGMFVSELSLGSRGWIQISNFIITGILLNIFTSEIFKEFQNGKAGSIILRIISISLLISGPLVMDPANTPRDQMSWHGILHGIFGALVFSLSPVCCFVFYRKFKEDTNWKSIQIWTLISGIIITVALGLLTYATKTNAISSEINNWIGLIQRLILIPFFGWVFIFAFELNKKNKKTKFKKY